jgi:hypothetical protein
MRRERIVAGYLRASSFAKRAKRAKRLPRISETGLLFIDDLHQITTEEPNINISASDCLMKGPKRTESCPIVVCEEKKNNSQFIQLIF